MYGQKTNKGGENVIIKLFRQTPRHRGTFKELMGLWLLDREKELNVKLSKGYAYGWTNRVFDKANLKKPAGWMVWVDYDRISREMAHIDVSGMQYQFKLGDAVLLKTQKGHHAYFFDIIKSKKELKKLARASLFGDKAFIEVGLVKSDSILTLRLGMKDGKKIKFARLIKSPWKKGRETSSTHEMLLRMKFKVRKRININRPKRMCFPEFTVYKLNNK